MGRIELIIGPMFAGKSTELIKTANKYKSIGMKVLTINHSLNNRYGTDDISTHDGDTIAALFVTNNLNKIMKDAEFYKALIDTDVVLIEELQFFQCAFEFVTLLADKMNKIVIAAGLSGDYNRKPFGDVLRLIPHAEKITSLSALCGECGDGTHAHFTRRTVDSTEHTIVGAGESYQAVCRKHYKLNK